jgi:hypothetical protein
VSRTSLQKGRRQIPATLPQGCKLVIDEDHDIFIERRSPQKWHVLFGETPEEKRYKESAERARRAGNAHIVRRFPVAVVVRYPEHGYDKAAEKQYQTTMGGTYEWFDMLAPAIERARQWLIMQDAVKRLRGE